MEGRTRTYSCAENFDRDVELGEMRRSGGRVGSRLAQESEVRQRREKYEKVEGRRRKIWKGKRLRLE